MEVAVSGEAVEAKWPNYLNFCQKSSKMAKSAKMAENRQIKCKNNSPAGSDFFLRRTTTSMEVAASGEAVQACLTLTSLTSVPLPAEATMQSGISGLFLVV